MDHIFKEYLVKCIVSLLNGLEADWLMQLLDLHELWEEVSNLIDKDCFKDIFIHECAILQLGSDEYDLEEAFEKVHREWKTEMMIKVAERIVYLNNNLGPYCETFIGLEDGCIRVEMTICKSMHPSFYL